MQQQMTRKIELLIQRLEGWCTAEKATYLAQLIVDTKPEISVELGVFGGRGTLSMALAHRENKKGYVVGIDPWAIDPCIEGNNSKLNDDWWRNVDYKSVYRKFIRAVLDEDLTEYTKWVRDKSQNAIHLFKDKSVNLLVQDSNHSELVSTWEVEHWSKKLAPGGWWVLDDTDWETTQKAFQMLTDRYSLIRNTGRWAVFKNEKK